MRREQRVLACLLLAWLGAGCGESLPFEPAGPDAAPDPAERGPFPVGVQTIVFEDPTRPNPDTGAPRRLVTEIWYPAVESTRDEEPYAYDVREELPADALPMVEGRELGVLETIAVRDAEPRKSDGPYPVVLFSHGAIAIRFQSTFLTPYLASHGYVVVAPDHEGNTLADLEAARGSADGVFDLGNMTQSLLDRPGDLSYVLRRLERDDTPFADLMDFGRVGVTGHSFGAVTALRTLALNDRVHTAVAQCPASYLLTWLDIEGPLDTIDAAVVIMAGGLDEVTPAEWAETIWEHVQRGSFVTIERAGHNTYSDLCRLDIGALEAAAEFGLQGSLENGCTDRHLPISQAHPIIRRHAIGHFNHTLRGSTQTASMLETSSSNDELTIERR